MRYPDYGWKSSQHSGEPSWSLPLDSTFRSLSLSDSSLVSMYFSSSSGHLRAFPGGSWSIRDPPNSFNIGYSLAETIGTSSKASDGHDHDSRITGFNGRFLPWYVLGASGPKDVVLVLDASTSMGSMYDARKAALNVIQGLTPQVCFASFV